LFRIFFSRHSAENPHYVLAAIAPPNESFQEHIMIFRKRGFRALALGLLVAAGLALTPAAFARGRVSVGIGLPGLAIGVGPHHTYVGVGGGYYAPGYYGPAYYGAPVAYGYDYGYPAYYGPAYYGGVVYTGGGYYRGGYRGGYYRGGYHGGYVSHGGGYYHHR
jgi:hypothetical protein